jgi:hypothetical protein
MEIYPLKDCIQIPLDSDFNEVLIYYYTDSPDRPYDAFTRKKYDIPNETPLYLCIEHWKWDGAKYNKEERIEELLEKEQTIALVKHHLKIVVPTHEWDFSYNDYFEKNKKFKYNLSHELLSPYYNLGEGCRWSRAWERTIYSGEDGGFPDDDNAVRMYGPMY